MSFDVRSKIHTKLPGPPAHPFGIALNLCDVEYESWCF